MEVQKLAYNFFSERDSVVSIPRLASMFDDMDTDDLESEILGEVSALCNQLETKVAKLLREKLQK